MKFLNGWKTILGAVGILATPLIATGGDLGAVAGKVVEAGQHLDAVIMGGAGVLTVLGVLHKIDKRRK